MKKYAKIIAVLMALTLLLCACGKKEEASGFNYGKVYDDNGYLKDIKASDYVKLPDLNSITLDKADLEYRINTFLAYYPDTKKITDRAVVDGDSLNIDYVGFIDGAPFEGGDTNGEGTDVTIGYTSYIDDFLEQLIGHFPGETFDINVTFPDPYPNEENNKPELAGKDATFRTTINHINEYVMPEWNDDFVSKNLAGTYGWETAAEAEQSIKEVLVEDYVLDNTEFVKDIPQELIDYITDLRLNYYEGYAAASNIEINSFLQYYVGVESVEAFRESFKEEATENAKFDLIYQAIAEAAGYSTSEDDIKAYFMDLNDTDDYSEYAEAFGLPYIKAVIMYENMSKKLFESAQIN